MLKRPSKARVAMLVCCVFVALASCQNARLAEDSRKPKPVDINLEPFAQGSDSIVARPPHPKAFKNKHTTKVPDVVVWHNGSGRDIVLKFPSWPFKESHDPVKIAKDGTAERNVDSSADTIEYGYEILPPSGVSQKLDLGPPADPAVLVGD